MLVFTAFYFLKCEVNSWLVLAIQECNVTLQEHVNKTSPTFSVSLAIKLSVISWGNLVLIELWNCGLLSISFQIPYECRMNVTLNMLKGTGHVRDQYSYLVYPNICINNKPQTFRLNCWSSKLQENNERKNTLGAQFCVLSDAYKNIKRLQAFEKSKSISSQAWYFTNQQPTASMPLVIALVLLAIEIVLIEAPFTKEELPCPCKNQVSDL